MGVGALSGPPWSWHAHPLAWVLVLLLGGGYLHLLRRAPAEVRARDQVSFAAALVLLYCFLDWPIADLADRSLLLHMAQQTVLLLVVPPLLLKGLRSWIGVWRAPAVLRRLTSPVGATVTFNVVVLTSFVPAVMNGAVGNAWAQAALDVGLLAGGLVMWVPGLQALPGAGRSLGHAGRAAYLIVQSVLPSFASLVFIFDRHPVYAAFGQAPRSLGLSPLADQQLAGALAKVVGLAVLLGAAGTILLRGDDGVEDHLPPGTLTWDDVERELRRLEGQAGPS